MSDEYTNKNYQGKPLAQSSASVVGGTVGAVAGSLVPGGIFLGAIAGTVLGEIVEKGFEDFLNRVLSHREQLRINSAASWAITKIKALLESGNAPRDDQFFQQDETKRSSADEIFEGVLLKAKNENQEKKIEFIGYFFANVAFRPDISADCANSFLRIAEELSYRQFCYLALINKVNSLDVEPLRNRIHSNHKLTILKQEEMYLHNASDFGGCGLITGDYSGYGYSDYLSDVGKLFFDLFELSKIPDQDIKKLAKLILLCKESHEIPPTLPQRNKSYSSKKITDLEQIFNL